MNSKNKSLKYILIALIVIFLVTSALLFLEFWDKNHGNFQDNGTVSGVVEYKGTKYELKDNIETFLIMGLDRFSDQTVADSHSDGVQADFLMLFVINNETKQYTAVHINRDTMTRVNKLSVGGASVVNYFTKQIALAYDYANTDNDRIRCGNTKESVEYLLHGVKVNHYLSIVMDAIPVINDFVGGVEVTLLDDFTDIDESYTEGATVTLRGDQALSYVRARMSMNTPTNTARMERQRQYITALYDKTIFCMKNDDGFAASLVERIDEYIAYDSSTQRMNAFVEKFDEYEFLGIREIEGEAVVGEKYMEFYPDDDSIWKIIIDLMYEPKK